MIDRARTFIRIGDRALTSTEDGLGSPRRIGRRGLFGLLAGATLAGVAGFDDAAARRRNTKKKRKNKNRDRDRDRDRDRNRDRKRNRKKKNGKGAGDKIVREAKKHNGDRYVAGGTAPGGFDCSGFTYYVVLKALGRDISPDLQAQTSVGRNIGKGKRRKGDLIFFTLEGGQRVTHVAIVLNKNRVIHAMNPQDGVKISDMNSAYYQDNIHSVRRL